jgi:hypothetical protein
MSSKPKNMHVVQIRYELICYAKLWSMRLLNIFIVQCMRYNYLK